MSKRFPSQHSILTQIAEEDAPSNEIKLWPGLQKSLAMGKFIERSGGYPMPKQHAQFPKTRRWQPAAVAIFLLALIILLVTPPGQAVAQQILGFFTPAKATTYPAPTAVLTLSALDGKADSTLAPTSTPSYAETCPQTEPDQQYACALNYVQQQTGFPLKALPVGSPLELTGVDIDPSDSAVSLYYGENATIILTQRNSLFTQSIRSPQNANGEVPVEAVQPVMINGQPGEYVEGGFILRPGSQEYTWESTMPMARLRWKDGDIWYEISKPGTPETLRAWMEDKDSFIRLAESLVAVEEIRHP